MANAVVADTGTHIPSSDKSAGRMKSALLLASEQAPQGRAAALTAPRGKRYLPYRQKHRGAPPAADA